MNRRQEERNRAIVCSDCRSAKEENKRSAVKTNNSQNNQTTGPEKRRSTFAILFYINRTKVRKDGMCQLLCKISIDADAEQIGTKVSVDPSLWNPQEGKANGRSRNALEVNDAIDKLTKKITDHYHQIRGGLGFVTAELIKNAINGVAQSR
jgi:hypothetical protein